MPQHLHRNRTTPAASREVGCCSGNRNGSGRTLSRCLSNLALVLSVCAASTAHASPTSLVAELSRLLAKGGHSAVDRLLDTKFDSVGKRFSELQQECDRPALALGLKLLNTTNVSALENYSYGLQSAMGRCPEVLLALAPPHRVTELCAVSALTELTDAESQVELLRRLSALEALPAGRSQSGLACAQAYRDELQRMRSYGIP